MKILLDAGADVNIGDDFVNINITSRNLSLNPIQVLYEREDEFSDRLNNRATFKSFTPLHYAVLTDNLELITLLLNYGADPLIENELGHRPYEYCATEEAKKLLDSYEKIVSSKLV